MIILIYFIPLIASINILILGRYLGYKGASILSILSILSSLTISINLLYNYIIRNINIKINLTDWINIGSLNIKYELLLDKYSILMIFLISIITSIVIIYSTWYLQEDPHLNRFLSYLLLFAVSMLILTSSSNFLVIFVGWEGVGLFSYLLINFWFTILNANKSSIKALLYNKLGDIGYSISILILIYIFSSLDLYNLYFVFNYKDTLYNFILLFFLLAASAKSAQILFHCWLGDAMAGPTPVSALLHAATMVTAGVFIIIRIEPLLLITNNNILLFISLIGGLTILFGGISSINQHDIKKIIAFSTCSQLGYMILSCGILYNNSGFYHLLTHGFFKALLFLSAGILIHLLNNEQDLRKYGSLSLFFPLSLFLFLIGTLAIISFPFLSGFYSKDAIIEATYHNHYLLSFCTILGGLLTSIYSINLFYMTFIYKPNFIIKFNKYYELSYSYYSIFIVLILGSIFCGYLFKDLLIGPGLHTIYLYNVNTINMDYEFIPYFYKILPLLFSLLGIILSLIFNKSYIYLINIKYHFLTLFNRRLFIDNINNYLFAFISSFIGYHYTFKIIDRGLLELFGPLGILRFFYNKFNDIYIASDKIIPNDKNKYSNDSYYNQYFLNINKNNVYLLFNYYFISLFAIFFIYNLF